MSDLAASGLHRKAREALEHNLRPGEPVTLIITGKGNSAIVGTDRRAFVFKTGPTSGATFGSALASWDYAAILGVRYDKGFNESAVIIETAAEQPLKRIAGKRHPAWQAPNAIPVRKGADVEQGVAMLRNLIDAARAGPSASAAALAGGVPVELGRLAELHRAGALSEEEFVAAKRRVLSP